jgi:hypothetical protein
MATYPTFKRLQKTSKDFKRLQKTSKLFKDFQTCLVQIYLKTLKTSNPFKSGVHSWKSLKSLEINNFKDPTALQINHLSLYLYYLLLNLSDYTN